MKQEYAISHWPDSKEILENLRVLANELPVYQINRSTMNEYLEKYESKFAKSKQMVELARQRIPGGVQHNLAFNYPFPLAIAKADGAYLYDVSGNRFIDFLQAGGPTVLGSNYKPVRDKVLELINECGPVTGLFHEYEYKLADLIYSHVPSVEMFRSLASGTEGCMAAIRAARCFTDKKFVIKVGGGYHGWSDQFVFAMRIPGLGTLDSHGIPEGCFQYMQEFYPNDTAALEKLLKDNESKGGTAAVIVEPLGPESGTRPVHRDFNEKVKALCDSYGTLLIFDEVVTGFRVGLGGAQGYFDIKPDLTVFGKCVAGGYPAAGGVGGRKEIMLTFAAGIQGLKKRAMVGGTLSANPLSCSAGYFAIKAIEETQAHLKAGKAGDRLTKGLQEIFKRYNLPFVAFNHGSICHMETGAAMLMELSNPKILEQVEKRRTVMEELGAALMVEGIITLAGSRIYTSMADTDDVIDDALERFDTVFKHFEPVQEK